MSITIHNCAFKLYLLTKYIVRTFWTWNWIPDICTTFRISIYCVKTFFRFFLNLAYSVKGQFWNTLFSIFFHALKLMVYLKRNNVLKRFCVYLFELIFVFDSADNLRTSSIYCWHAVQRNYWLWKEEEKLNTTMDPVFSK